MDTPIDLATFKLTMNSSFVGCSIGRSPGFAPSSTCTTIFAKALCFRVGVRLNVVMSFN